jgi:hypothetical protein
MLDVNEVPDAHLAVPTRGRCPICRKEISLFQLKAEKDGTELYEKDVDIANSPLGGTIFKDLDEDMTLYFPTAGSDDRPHLSFSQEDLKLDDATPVPKKCYFDEGCHFHAKSSTFHGTITWARYESDKTTFHGAEKWECILQYSADFRFIKSGNIVKHLRSHKHPFDGRWRVKWLHDGSSDHLLVKASEIRLGYVYRLDLTNPKKPSFSWPDFGDGNGRVVQSIDYDLEANPDGPAVGESIVWNTTHPVQSRIQWVRASSVET